MIRTIPANAARNSENSCKDPHVQFHSISNIAIQEGLKCDEREELQLRKMVQSWGQLCLKGGKDNITMSVPTSCIRNSIKHIHILFGAFSVELKREDENFILIFHGTQFHTAGNPHSWEEQFL
jgi:hypothetical protein